VDLIYIDPPFNSNRNYEVFWGETKEKRAFEDRHENTKAYIDYMRPRCVQLARVLKKTGSFYYHCDWHASHYVKVMLDQIFGENNFSTKSFGRNDATRSVILALREMTRQKREIPFTNFLESNALGDSAKNGWKNSTNKAASSSRKLVRHRDRNVTWTKCPAFHSAAFGMRAGVKTKFKRSHKVIVALIVQEILEEHIAKKLM
jgi:hypothetical protein